MPPPVRSIVDVDDVLGIADNVDANGCRDLESAGLACARDAVVVTFCATQTICSMLTPARLRAWIDPLYPASF